LARRIEGHLNLSGDIPKEREIPALPIRHCALQLAVVAAGEDPDRLWLSVGGDSHFRKGG
jgi:hypothetical protein